MWFMAGAVQALLAWVVLQPDLPWALPWMGIFLLLGKKTKPLTILTLGMVTVGTILCLIAMIHTDQGYYTYWLGLVGQGEAMGSPSAYWNLGMVCLVLGLGVTLGRAKTSLMAQVPWILLSLMLPWAIILGSPPLFGMVIGTLVWVLVNGRKQREPGMSTWKILGVMVVKVGASLALGFLMFTVFPPAQQTSRAFFESLRTLTKGIGALLLTSPLGESTNHGESEVLRFSAPPPQGRQVVYEVKAQPGTTVYLALGTNSRLSDQGWIPDPSLELFGTPNRAQETATESSWVTLTFMGEMTMVVPLLPRPTLVSMIGAPVEYAGSISEGYGLPNLYHRPLTRGQTMILRPSPENHYQGQGPYHLAVPKDIASRVLPFLGTIPTLPGINERITALLAFFDDARYNQDVEFSGSMGEQIEDFLVGQEGWCTQFATSFAIMARMSGIPARVIHGYSITMPRDNNIAAIEEQDAHAWVELWLPELGWTMVDPTPGGIRDFATNTRGEQNSTLDANAATTEGDPHQDLYLVVLCVGIVLLGFTIVLVLRRIWWYSVIQGQPEFGLGTVEPWKSLQKPLVRLLLQAQKSLPSLVSPRSTQWSDFLPHGLPRYPATAKTFLASLEALLYHNPQCLHGATRTRYKNRVLKCSRLMTKALKHQKIPA